MASNKISQSPHTLQLNNELSECNRLYQFLTTLTHQYNIAEDILYDIKLAAEEIVANIITHGYNKTSEKSPGQTIDVSISIHADYITIRFSDNAVAYNPLKPANEPDCEKDYCEGGMGLKIIQSVTDEQNYKRINDCNIFIITKHYTTPE